MGSPGVTKQAKANTPPRPETTRAYLPSNGYHKPIATLHHHFETRAIRLRTGAPVWEHIYKCFKTGALRRWGIEERNESPTAEREPSEREPAEYEVN